MSFISWLKSKSAAEKLIAKALVDFEEGQFHRRSPIVEQSNVLPCLAAAHRSREVDIELERVRWQNIRRRVYVIDARRGGWSGFWRVERGFHRRLAGKLKHRAHMHAGH